MEKVTQKEVNRSELPTVRIEEYNFSADINANVARVELKGRYPESGMAINNECDEVVYVKSGKGKLISKDAVIDFMAEDSICIEKGEVYAWEGDCELIIYCSPAFTAEQHEEIE